MIKIRHIFIIFTLFSLSNCKYLFDDDDSGELQFAVPRPPKINLATTLTRIKLERGDNVTITCELSQGTPTPRFQWFKDGKALPKEPYFSTETSLTRTVLQMTNITEKEVDGGYSCIAYNFLGKSQRHFAISVSGGEVIWIK